MKKILVTGGTGFIGRPVVAELIARGYEVHVSTSSSHTEILQACVVHELNLMDLEKVRTFIKKNCFDGVFHLAWLGATGAKCHDANENVDWTIATLNLLRSYVEHGGRKFLGAGTISEYDFSYGYLREDATPLTSKFLYGQCKSSLYNIGSTYARENNVDFKWARIFNLYGPHEKHARLVPAVINSILRGEDIKVSDCLKFQDYLHVFDAARGVVDLFESTVHGAVNICSGSPVRLRTIVEKIVELSAFKGNVLWGAIPSYFDDPLIAGSNARLVREVGWSAQIGLDQGLQMTIDWWKDNQNV